VSEPPAWEKGGADQEQTAKGSGGFGLAAREQDRASASLTGFQGVVCLGELKGRQSRAPGRKFTNRKMENKLVECI
jgi:hypothetical protein